MVVEIDTRETRLSQFDHKAVEYRKKRLSERWHVFDDGPQVQRDLYSAWLARHVHEKRLDASPAPGQELAECGTTPLAGGVGASSIRDWAWFTSALRTDAFGRCRQSGSPAEGGRAATGTAPQTFPDRD